MEQDIRKLADWIEKAARETVAVERKILEWKSGENDPAKKPVPQKKS